MDIQDHNVGGFSQWACLAPEPDARGSAVRPWAIHDLQAVSLQFRAELVVEPEIVRDDQNLGRSADR
jgi:hypothetical protein